MCGIIIYVGISITYFMIIITNIVTTIAIKYYLSECVVNLTLTLLFKYNKNLFFYFACLLLFLYLLFPSLLTYLLINNIPIRNKQVLIKAHTHTLSLSHTLQYPFSILIFCW